MKKLLSLVLACLMVVGMLAACGKQDGGEESKKPDASGNADAGKPTEIVWFIRADQPKNYDAVMAAVNEKLKADLNMTLDLRCIAPGDYNSKMQMALSGGDDWDLCFTSNWANNYANAAGKGAYLEITPEMLKEYAPDVVAAIPENLWNGIKINNKLYALMNYQVMYDQPGLYFIKAAVDEQNIDVSTLKDWDSLNAALEKLAKAYPDKYATRGGGVIQPLAFFQEETINSLMNYPWLAYDAETLKLDNMMAFEKLDGFLKSAKLWKDNNWCPADAATLKDENTLMASGQILSRYNRHKPGTEADMFNRFKQEVVCIPTGDATINTNAATSTLTAVNVNSKHPEKAIELYNYVFGNKEIANMLFFGLEGQDFEMVDGRVKRLENCWNVPQWQLGNQFNANLTVNDVDGVWEETMKGNAEAKLEPLFGFVPNRAPVETELATCEAIWNEYKDILYYGLRDHNEAIPEMMDKMQKAGLEKVTTELQSQIDEFVAAQGK